MEISKLERNNNISALYSYSQSSVNRSTVKGDTINFNCEKEERNGGKMPVNRRTDTVSSYNSTSNERDAEWLADDEDPVIR